MLLGAGSHVSVLLPRVNALPRKILQLDGVLAASPQMQKSCKHYEDGQCEEPFI